MCRKTNHILLFVKSFQRAYVMPFGRFQPIYQELQLAIKPRAVGGVKVDLARKSWNWSEEQVKSVVWAPVSLLYFPTPSLCVCAWMILSSLFLLLRQYYVRTSRNNHFGEL